MLSFAVEQTLSVSTIIILAMEKGNDAHTGEMIVSLMYISTAHTRELVE